MIHDYTDRENPYEDIDEWGERFGRQDIVIAPGYSSFRTMVVVDEINPDDSLEKVTHKGVFWDKSEAEAYAESRHRRTHKDGDSQ